MTTTEASTLDRSRSKRTGNEYPRPLFNPTHTLAPSDLTQSEAKNGAGRLGTGSEQARGSRDMERMCAERERRCECPRMMLYCM